MVGKILAVGLVFAGMACAQGDPARAFDAATAAVRRPGTTVRVDLIGDSTQTDNAGYGRGFCANLSAAVDCVNMAKGGASTRSFRAQGLWERAIQTKPDYMLIQFGHNDVVFNRPPAATGTAPGSAPANGPAFEGGYRALTNPGDYEANLRQYVTEARAAGIKPILVTPLTRQYFEADGKIHSDQTEHSATMRRIAAEMKVPLIELQDESIAYLEKAGEDAGHKFEITKKDPAGATIFDKTHLNWAGSYVFGRIVAVDLGKAAPELNKYVRPEAAKLPPEGVKAMQVINSGAVKIVLVGDSTVATGGGWGPGFCAVMTKNVTCIDDALNGRSSKSFIDEGAWKKALDEHGDYYLIQFGHNDQKPNEKVHTDAETSFQDYLQRYIADVRAIGAVPVLVTSLSRRTFKDGKVIEDLTAYVNATKAVGAKDGITVIDLNAISTALLNRMTQEEADQFDAELHPDAKAENPATTNPAGPASQPKLDRTHLNPHGQKIFGRIVADQLVRTQVELGPDVVGEPMASQVATSAAPAKAYAFDVVSIRRNITPMQMMGPQSAPPVFGPTADGYRMTNMSMGMVIMTAYVPQIGGSAFFGPNNVKGYPDWFNTERYDIDARIADEDRAEWQKPEAQKAMLHAMLQAMLVDRCKLAVHREVKEVGVSSLVVAKGGVKFKETDPSVEHPDGIKLPWGGVLVPSKDGMNLYGTTMASLASLLSTVGGGMGGGGRTIQDKTGLTGKYDISMKQPAPSRPAPDEQQSGTAASDPGAAGIYSILGDLGLKLETAKGQVETLVIDHMERPSAN